MVRAVEQLEQDIAALDKMIAAAATEFQNTYASYLTALGKAVQQQLILAGYQLCTQGYPEQFLCLSFGQRQQLQQSLRHIAQEAQAQLESLHNSVSTVASGDSSDSESQSAERVLDSEQRLEDSVALEELEELEEEAVSWETLSPEINLESGLDSSDSAPSSAESISESEPETDPEKPQITPESVLQWQEKLEKAIAEVLQMTSRRANRLFQKSEIFSPKVPEPILEMAVNSQAAAESISGPPNLLNLLIEAIGESGSDKSSPQDALLGSSAPALHIIAVHLRLSEIEFTDAKVMAWRTQIRNWAGRLGTLHREYQKKRQEWAVAQAEAAWRSSWFDA